MTDRNHTVTEQHIAELVRRFHDEALDEHPDLRARGRRLGYLRQALKVNPASQRAPAGLLWAQQRVERAAQTVATRQVRVRPTLESAPALAATAPQRVKRAVQAPPRRLNGFQIAFFLLLPLVFVGLLTLVIWSLTPTQAAQASPLVAASPRPGISWALAALQKPTATPTETPTATPTIR